MFAPSDFLTIGLLIALEGLLSADNAMVLAILVLGLPKSQQKKALKYGMGGAFAFRAIATLLAAYMIQLGWVKLVGAGYLLYLVYRHFGTGESADDRRAAPPAKPWLGLSAFWATVVKVELTDIVFAVEYGHTEGYVHFEVPKFISLGVIVVIFGAALAYALWKERADGRAGSAGGKGD